jgi:outer membrane receptor protein involved in Fe transport
MPHLQPSAAAVRRCVALILSIGAASLLPAQPAPNAAALQKYDLNRNGVLDANELEAMRADEAAAATAGAIVLTPFEVSTDKDRGYAAGNTLSGGRADTPLKITPNSISVMTKEFLDDFAITDMNDAAAWTISMEPPTGGESGPFGGNRFQASFRGGDSGANFPQRNGALQYFIADSYNSERFEFSRGPSTALFGDGGPGGIQGSTSKQARLNNVSTQVGLRADSFGGYRGTLDYNYGLDQVGLRVNALHQNTKSFQDGTSNKQNALSLAGTYRFAQNTQIRAEYERSAEWNIQFRRTYNEQASIWNRTTVNQDNTAITSPGLSGLGQISPTNDFLIYNFGTNNLYNYRGNQYQTVGLGYAIPWGGRPDLPTNFRPGIDKEFFLGPADSFADRDLNAKAVYLEHRFSPDWSAQLAYIASDVDPRQVNISGGQAGDYRIDVNRLLPDGTNNPNFGRAYSDTGAQATQYQQDSVKEYRLITSYRFGVEKWFDMSQRFSLNTGWRNGIFEIRETSWRWANNPNQPDLANASNQIRYRMYWDQPRATIAPVIPPSIPGYTFREIPINTGSNARRSRTLTYGQLVSQTTFWDEKIALTGTFRRDKIVLNSRQAVRFDNYVPVLGFGGVEGATGRREVWHNSKSAGVVFYPFPERLGLLAPLGFVANYSSNFQQIPNNVTPIITGEQAPLTQAITKDWGLRYSMADGRVYMTLTHYQTYQLNVLSGWGNAGDFRNIYRNLGYSDDNALIGPNGFSFQDVGSRALRGWEFEVTANPSRNLTLTANYAHPEATTISDSIHRRAFFAQNEAEYRAGAAAQTGQIINGRAIIDPAIIQTSLLNIENSLNGFTPGTLNNGIERHRVNLNGRYGFTEGKLRGFAVVGGVRYRSHRKIGSRDARLKFQVTNPTIQQNAEAAYDYLWTEPTWFSTLGANYTRRVGKYTVRLQLNIDNLLDDNDPQWGAYSVIQAGQLTGQANANALTVAGSNPRMQVVNAANNRTLHLDPRKFTFTTTISF